MNYVLSEENVADVFTQPETKRNSSTLGKNIMEFSDVVLQQNFILFYFDCFVDVWPIGRLFCLRWNLLLE